MKIEVRHDVGDEVFYRAPMGGCDASGSMKTQLFPAVVRMAGRDDDGEVYRIRWTQGEAHCRVHQLCTAEEAEAQEKAEVEARRAARRKEREALREEGQE